MTEELVLRSGKRALLLESGGVKIFHGEQSVVIDEDDWQSLGIQAGWFA